MNTRYMYRRFVSALSLCIALTILTIQCGATAESRYKNMAPLDAVVAQNESKITRIASYGPEFVLDYIAVGRSYNDIVNVLFEVQLLSDTICSGITDEYEKIRALENYVANTIAYDHDAAHNSVTFDIICLKNVLERKRTTCAGFSNLLSALCNAQGIYCVNIRGSAPDAAEGVYRTTLDSDDTPINHEWTAVWYSDEHRWLYCDPTWDSKNTYYNGAFSYNDAGTVYFDISLFYLSIDHKAEIVDYRNFFSAPEAYNSDGVLLSEDPGEVSTVYSATETSGTSVVTKQTLHTIVTTGAESNDSATTPAYSAQITTTPVSDVTTTLSDAVSSETTVPGQVQIITGNDTTLAEGALSSKTDVNGSAVVPETSPPPLSDSIEANNGFNYVYVIIPAALLVLILVIALLRAKSSNKTKALTSTDENASTQDSSSADNEVDNTDSDK